MYNRNVYTASSNKSSPAPSRTVTIIDPAFRTGKLDIPIEKTSATKGRDEWLEGKLRNKDLSLCCLFQKGRCHAQERCHQVHADRDYVTSLRQQQSSIVSCCRFCNDSASLSPAAMSFFATHMRQTTSVRITFGDHDEPNVIPAVRVAYTDGLIQQFQDHGCRDENGSISIPARRVCRLHAKSACKYGKDCKNVHVCCEIGEKSMQRPLPGASARFSAPLHSSSPAKSVATTTPAKQDAPRPIVVECPVPRTTVAPLPAFAVPSSASSIVDKDPLETTAAPLNKSAKISALDADSLNESSGRLRALVFDVLKCLDDSCAEQKKDNTDDEDNFSYFSSTKEASKAGNRAPRNGADNSPNTKALQWGTWHPCSNTPKSNIISPAAVDPSNFLRFF